MKDDTRNTAEQKPRLICEDERSPDCSSGSEDSSQTEEIEVSVGGKRARRYSREDAFSELERFVTQYGLACSKACRFHKFDLSGEEGTDMSFLVLPLTIEQKFDLAVQSASALNNFLETEQ